MSKQKRRYVTLVVVLTLIVVGGASAGIWYAVENSVDKEVLSPETTAAEKKSQTLVDSALASDDASDQKIAAKKLQKLADDSNNKDDRTTYNGALVSLYNNKGDHKAALKTAKTIEADKPTDYSASLVADTYEMSGDYKNAAKYYGIAAERVDKPKSETERAPYNDYMNAKRAAEAKL